jgi:hypothetical protein
MDLHLLDRTGTIHDLRKERRMHIMLWPSSFKRGSKRVAFRFRDTDSGWGRKRDRKLLMPGNDRWYPMRGGSCRVLSFFYIRFVTTLNV